MSESGGKDRHEAIGPVEDIAAQVTPHAGDEVAGKSNGSGEPLLTPEGLDRFRSDLAALRSLDFPVWAHLRQLAAADPLNMDKITRVWNRAPTPANRALAYLLSLDDAEFDELSELLGDELHDLPAMRTDLLPLGMAVNWLAKRGTGRINTWRVAGASAFIDLADGDPWMEMKLYDDLGDVLYESRSTIRDFLSLSHAVLSHALDSVESAVDANIPLSKPFRTRLGELLRIIEDECHRKTIQHLLAGEDEHGSDVEPKERKE